MVQLPTLISDLALILVLAGIIALLFKWLKQPLVLGYIVAGVLASPYLHLTPSVQDVASINIWAEIGVVFLLFALGLQFSFKKLMNVGGTAGITAITEVIFMVLVGFGIGQLLGWNTISSLMLGGMLTMSSTTIIIKTFDELGLRSQKFTHIVFGVLVVEDLVAILMMVLVSTIAVTQAILGEAILENVLRLGFFLTLWFVVGIFLLPAFFRKMKKYMNDEMLMVIALGLCLFMVVTSAGTGFSAALGAFIMGSILAETVEAEHIERLVRPVKDLFGAIFFISVGMMIDLSILAEHAFLIVAIATVAILGKSFAASLGVLLSGQPLKTSLQAGLSLGQIGEFSFIIAGLGVTLKVLNAEIHAIIVAVSVLTIFASPYVLQLATPLFNWLDRILPNNVKAFLDRYASGGNTINHESDWKKVLKKFTTRMVINSVVLTGVFLLAIHVISPFIDNYINDWWSNIITAIIGLLMMSPFLASLVLRQYNYPELFMSLWSDSKYNRGRLVSLVLLRIFTAMFFVSILFIKLFSVSSLTALIIALAIMSVVFLLRGSLNQYSRIEKHFLTNLNEREMAEENKKSAFKKNFTTELQERDIHLTTVTVSPDSTLVGHTLAELDLRRHHKVNVVKIFRGSQRINIPTASDVLYPYDVVTLVGNNLHLGEISKLLEVEPVLSNDEATNEVQLRSFTVDEHFKLLGQPIASSHISRCLVVGIERDGVSFYPEHSKNFEVGDLVWVVGEPDNISKLVSCEQPLA